MVEVLWKRKEQSVVEKGQRTQRVVKNLQKESLKDRKK